MTVKRTYQTFPEDWSSLLALARKLGNDRPLRRVLSIVHRLGCKSYIHESGLTHSGFESEHEAYYRYMHPPVPKTVERLHFLLKTITKSSEFDNLENTDYIGYVTLRPLPEARVCDSIITPPPPTSDRYILVNSKYSVELNQRSFQITGVPFIQQDRHAGVCAHASLAMISRIMSQLFPEHGYCAKTIGEIRDAISTVTAGNVAAPGLELTHVSKAFEQMGFASDTIYRFPEDAKAHFSPEHLVYNYLESGLPIFVGLRFQDRPIGHSIVVVGHNFDSESWWPDAWPLYYARLPSGESWLSSVAWVPDFIIQDDNFGPYMSMSKHLCNFAWIAVPLPRHILLKSENAEALAFWNIRLKVFRDTVAQWQKGTEAPWGTLFLNHLSNGRIVIRTVLMSKSRFYSHLEDCVGLHTKVKEFYKQLDLSEWLWLVEISVPELFSNKLRLGEVLINASYPPNFLPGGIGLAPIYAAHTAGALVTYDQKKNDFERHLLDGDGPYTCLIRPEGVCEVAQA